MNLEIGHRLTLIQTAMSPKQSYQICLDPVIQTNHLGHFLLTNLIKVSV
jgi:hypothetical protein